MTKSRLLYIEASFWLLSWQENLKQKDNIFNGKKNHQQGNCQTSIPEKLNSKKLTESSSSASASTSASPGGSDGLSCRPEPESSKQVIDVRRSRTEYRATSLRAEAPWSSMPGAHTGLATERSAFIQTPYLRSHQADLSKDTRNINTQKCKCLYEGKNPQIGEKRRTRSWSDFVLITKRA